MGLQTFLRGVYKGESNSDPLLSLAGAPPVMLSTMMGYSQEGPHQSQYHVT